VHLEIGYLFGFYRTNRPLDGGPTILFSYVRWSPLRLLLTPESGKHLRTVIWSLSPSRAAPHIVSFRLFSSRLSVLHVKPIIILHFVTSPLTSTWLSPLFEEPRGLTSSLASPPHDASACVYPVSSRLICSLSQFVATVLTILGLVSPLYASTVPFV